MLTLQKNNHVKFLIACCLLSVFTYTAFNSVLGNSFVTIDDPVYVYNNPVVTQGLSLSGIQWAFTTTELSNWHPLTWISHMVDVSLYGTDPKGHHATNLVFHLLNGILCFFLFYRITNSLSRGFLIALLFSIHPLRAESVAWVSERKDVLSAFFAFLSLICYLEYGRKKSLPAYAFCLICLVFSLLSKAMFVTLPFIFLLLDYWPLNRIKVNSLSEVFSHHKLMAFIIEKLPFFCLVGIICVITYRCQDRGGATFLSEYYPFWWRCENAAISYIRYIGKMLLPVRLGVFYPLKFSAFTVWQSLGAVLTLITATLLFLKASGKRYLIVGWLWYLVSLAPVIGIVQIGAQSMADRYTYFPCLGILLIFVMTGAELAARNKISKYILMMITIGVALFFYVQTFIQTTYWKNSLTLFQHTLTVTKQNPLTQLFYGIELEKAREYEEARRQYLQVHRQVPDQVSPLIGLSRVYLKQNDIPQAAEYARQACRLTNYHEPEALQQLAHVLYEQGKPEDALNRLQQALQYTDKQKRPDLYAQLQALCRKIEDEKNASKENSTSPSGRN